MNLVQSIMPANRPEAWNSMYCKNPLTTLLGKTCSKIHLSSTLFQTIIGLKLIWAGQKHANGAEA